MLCDRGVYLGGGIPRHLLPALKTSRFMQSFVRRDRFAELLSRIPVRVIVVKAALIGAARCGLELTLRERDSGF
jgi:glucokinase